MNGAPLRHERGLTSLAVIFALAVLGVLIALTGRALRDTSATVSAVITSERAVNRATDTLFEGLIRTRPESGFIRRSVTGTWGTTTAHLSSFELHIPPTGALQKPLYTRSDGPIPSFDTTLLFTPRAPCLNVGPSRFDTTPHGEPLTTTAAVGTTTCVLTGAPLPSPPHFGENLVATSPIRFDYPPLSNPPTEPPAILTSRGFIELRAELVVARSTIVFAGGDIFIDRIVGVSPASEITLIAATGRIVVRAVDGAPRLRVIAYAGAALPSGVSLSTIPPLPPIVPIRLLGFTRGVE